MQIQEKIKQLRKARGISQQELADKIGLNMSYLSRLENGHHEPSIEVVRKLMQCFEVSADFLLNDSHDEYEVKIKDKSLAEKIRLIDTLPQHKREALGEIIDDMLTNERMRQTLLSEKAG